MRVYPTKRSPKSQARIAGTLALALTFALAAASLATASEARLAVLRWSWSIAIEIMSVTEALAEADLIVKGVITISRRCLKWLRFCLCFGPQLYGRHSLARLGSRVGRSRLCNG